MVVSTEVGLDLNFSCMKMYCYLYRISGFFWREANFVIFFQIGGIIFGGIQFSRSWVLTKIKF